MSADSVDPHIQVLRDALVADHEQRIAEEQRAADTATDDWYRKWHQDHVTALRSMRYPWEHASDAVAQ